MLVVFEGIDGTGKSTQARLLVERIEELHGKDKVVLLSEPTKKTRYGRKIRELLSDPDREVSFDDELSLFFDDRKLNVNRYINPALRKEKIVVMDRYYFSTASYQGARLPESLTGKIDYRVILEMNEKFAPVPDLLFIFFIPVVDAMERIGGDESRESKSYMEKEGNLSLVQEIYEKIHGSGRYPSTCIDARLPVDEIRENTWAIFKERFDQRQVK
jgi:dTMP kinase